jgi:myosin heavy subunit
MHIGDRKECVLGADGNARQLKQEIGKMNVNYRVLNKINQQFQKDESDIRENMNGLTYKNDALSTEIQRLQKEIQQLQQHQQVQQGNNKMHEQIQKRREEKSEMEYHNQQLRREKRQAQYENQQLREENTKSIDEIQQLRQAKGQMENEIQQLKQEKSEMENENEQIRRKRSQLENENQQLRQETDDIISEMQETRQEKHNMENEIQQYREDTMATIFTESGSVVVSNEELGRGAWGAVYRGDFYGTKVAVKEFYQIILSPHNARILDREIEIASQCRHPNLLQFICATENDQHHLLIVTELMDMTLRTLLEQRAREKSQWKYQEIKSISLDVARGLNYLHSKTPNPIIHRDVSSANVLLWIENGAVRRAKISDYGSANFMKVSQTANSGSPLHAAPEANREIQDPKVNIFESNHTNQ